MEKNLRANAGDIRDAHSIFGSGRSLGGGHGNSSILARRIHGQRSLESPWDCKESNLTVATEHKGKKTKVISKFFVQSNSNVDTKIWQPTPKRKL